MCNIGYDTVIKDILQEKLQEVGEIAKSLSFFQKTRNKGEWPKREKAF